MKSRSKQTLILLGLLLLILVGIAARGLSGFSLPAEAIIAMTVNSAVERPYLLREDGRVLEPGAAGQWHLMQLEAGVRALHLGSRETLWAAADTGLFRYEAGIWTQVDEAASQSLSITHGYVLALGETQFFRVSEGGFHADERRLALPQAAAGPPQLVMLGNHSHVLRTGTALYLTESLGLSWKPIEAPDAIRFIGVDAADDLLAASNAGLLRWDWRDASWTQRAALPPGESIGGLALFEEAILLLRDGRVYRLEGQDWQPELIGEGVYVAALAVQYPDRLWALDTLGATLWTKKAGQADWEPVAIVLDE